MGKISQERINPLPLICDIIDGILSEELAFPKDEPVYKCKALTNLLVALHDTHNNENWARNFDPKSLQKQFYRVLQEFSLTKEQISSTTGKSCLFCFLILNFSFWKRIRCFQRIVYMIDESSSILTPLSEGYLKQLG